MDYNFKSIVYYKDGRPVHYVEGSGDSSETKPTGPDAEYITDGSAILESDTGRVFIYNKKSDSWIEL